jgi:outer membrane protein assembly factor BamB
MRRAVYAAFCLSLSLPLSPAKADWPQWRGPNRDGHAVGAKLPAKWPEKAPSAKWTAPVGEGYGGAAAAGGKVFVMGRKPVTLLGYDFSIERCLCFDADTGKQAWAIEYVQTFRPPAQPGIGKGPNSTPTVDRDRVYMFGLGGMLHCIEIATGEVLWKHDCRAEFWGVKFLEGLGDDAWFPPCGVATSPLVVGDTVVVSVGGPKAGAVTAFDRNTGNIVWKALDDRGSYASPLTATLGGAKQVVAMTGTRMVGIGGADHKLLWEVPYKAHLEQTIITPLVWKDLVIHGGDGRPTYAVRVTESGGRFTAEQVWKNEDLKEYMVNPVAFGDHLIGYDTRANKLVCLALETGETVWTSPRITGKQFSIVIAGDVALVLNSEGELYIVRASPKEFEQLAKWKVSGQVTWSHLAVAGNRLYVKDQDTLHCYEL